MTTLTYKGHLIERSGYSVRTINKPLYLIEGKYCKQATSLPALTTMAEAKEWINKRLAAEARAAEDWKAP